jgi:hypothetical protein
VRLMAHPGFEPGLPLRLQRVLGPCLVTAVHQHGDGRFILPSCNGVSGCFWIGAGLYWSGPRPRAR